MQKNSSEMIPLETISQKIFIIRGVKVMLDIDLAELYQVPTKRLNEQVKRNKDRFPTDFMFQLSNEENRLWNRSQFATGSEKHRDPRFLPYAFTEHGVAMLSSVLRSPRAVQMNIFIIRAFIKLREMLVMNKDLAQRVDLLEREQEKQGENINVINTIVKQLIDEPIRPKERIGFRQN